MATSDPVAEPTLKVIGVVNVMCGGIGIQKYQWSPQHASGPFSEERAHEHAFGMARELLKKSRTPVVIWSDMEVVEC